MSAAGQPYAYLTPSGVIVPDTADILTEVQNEYKDALDAPDLNVTSPGTPQYALINAETNNRAAQVGNNAALANQINPNVSGGIFLQAICALTGVDIPTAQPTLVPGVTVTGEPFTILSVSSQAETRDLNGTLTGHIFRTTEQVQFNSAGTATVDFEAVEAGPIACPVGWLTRVVSGVLGWETVYNSSQGTLGTLAPSDVALRQLRNNTLALQGQGLSEAVTSALYATTGVLSVAYRENKEGTTQVIDGITLVKNSIWACVQGGSDLDVANALFNSKSGGCNYNGTTTVTLTDPNSGQLCPVSFDRPTAVPLVCQVTVILPNTTYTANDVVQALLDYQAGLISGQAGFVLGAAASPFDMASGITTEIPGVVVRNLQIGLKSGGGLSPSEINMALNQVAALAASDITVVSTFA